MHVLGDWKDIRIHNQLDVITHSQFADDTVVFGEASMSKAKCIMDTLNLFSESSGQVMNRDKSQIYFFNTNRLSQLRISEFLGIKIAELLMKYLGIRIDKGFRQTHIWDDVHHSCEAKSLLRKNHWLSQAGRLTMVQSVLSVIHVYSMSCYKLPHSIGKKLDNLLRKFIWDGAKDANKIPLINWETMCLQKESGGAGLRKMELQNIALGAKLT
ncbi:uncharacterized protein LOC131860099 [Cryptomeria japonica]|uniref:uncharacterized protein LOC131860099 n=1 Tax=Cryptomeria japonica TaxID=3369 RepID=UPI0027D9E85F|nr:uncharacterized protein LOC131860099 [Cryptomeria japonica]